MTSAPLSSPCPCGAGATYAQCCHPFHAGEKNAPTAEKLMRSRYSAFALHNEEYLLRSWHLDTRPRNVDFDERVQWQRLIINDTTGGMLFDDHGTVEFTALYTVTAPDGTTLRERQHELSTFTRVDGAWVYVDGEL